jgi:ABC-2 type transport system permease protein
MNPTLMGFIKKELIQSLRDPRMKFLLFVLPLVQMTLFGVSISNEVKNIRLAANFDNRDYILRDIYERAIEGKWFIPAKSSGELDPFKLIQGGEADAVLIPPPGGFTKAVGRGSAPLQLLVNATNVLEGQAVESYIASIANEVVKGHLKNPARISPVKFEMRVLYNPSLDTSIFMVPGVICMLMMMTTMNLAMAAFVREKELGTFETLISAPVSRYELIFGKTIPYIILGMVNYPILLSIAFFVFKVPLRGSFLALTISSFVFVCTSVSIGTLFSTFLKNQQQANLGSFLFLFPAIMFSGLMFPLENMPTIFQWIAYTDPLAHYLGLLRNIMLKGGGLKYVFIHTSVLMGMTVICTFLSFKRLRTNLT